MHNCAYLCMISREQAQFVFVLEETMYQIRKLKKRAHSAQIFSLGCWTRNQICLRMASDGPGGKNKRICTSWLAHYIHRSLRPEEGKNTDNIPLGYPKKNVVSGVAGG